MIFNHAESFHKNIYFTRFKKFWVVENSLLIVTKFNEIDTTKKAKRISTFDFTTLYTAIPHNLLIKVLSEVMNFVFKSKTPSRIGFSKTSIPWTSKGYARRYFTRQTLIDFILFLIKIRFTIGNLMFKQEIGIYMVIGRFPLFHTR